MRVKMLYDFFRSGNSDSSRIQWIDNSRGICMFIVIVVHSGYMPEIYRYFVEPFFLTTFFFISGYLFNNPDRDIYIKIKLLSIVESVLIPYLVYWVLSYTVAALLKGEFSVLSLLKDIAMGNKLWFIAALFLSQIMFSIQLNVNRNVTSILIFSFGSVLLWYFTPLSQTMTKFPWSINSAFVANFFIGLGYISRIYKQQFLQILNDFRVGIFVGIAFLFFFILNYILLNFPYNFPANDFGNIGVFIVHSLLGVYSTLFISNLIKDNYVLMFIGANSLLFYFFQNQALKVVKKIAMIFDVTSPSYVAPLIMALTAVLLLTIPIILVNRYFPVMAGKAKPLSRKVVVKYE